MCFLSGKLSSQDPRKTVGFDLLARIAQGGLRFKRNIQSALWPLFSFAEKIMERLTVRAFTERTKNAGGRPFVPAEPATIDKNSLFNRECIDKL